MALAAKLQLRQSQSLVMTPQLMQSIRLLQLTHVELERFIEDEIERNPLLERAEPQDDAASDQAQKSDAAPESAADGDWFEAETEWSAEAISDKLDSSLENLFPDDPGTSERLGPDLTAQWKSASGSGMGASSSEGFDVGDMAATAITLREHVGEQIALAFADPAARLIAGELGDGLDEAGYLSADMAEIGVEVSDIALKDVILPGEMREILNQVVSAEKQAEANVIRRREETNATRSLLNTAKVMAENPVMLRLKELEALEAIAGKVERLTVHNGTGGLLNDLVKLRDS
ncbi:hypothetical protein EOA33_20450 [Mesorhizobium sp. M4A.F.Ca.ET.050.02.1.1]|uniref:SPFH domain-containing protein n=1 Tax=Mesorhizobium sp. M4A.F.Ca.ET.050.02.1.1 TaxID=2496754 RepID=UPI000FCA4389|nr:SPFH domain-containing protein [Mesorhizobium sp. M4A.F.Ca.ET.050.02.1.1]RUX46705.1 hypothetical protein EOA33_20450 [Mesorhizobium sp. M4A.F.Ca.ET.050.02.1.1]